MTIAQQLNVTEFPFEIHDAHGRCIYFEQENGEWYRLEFDANGNEIYFEESFGYWERRKFDADGNETYYEDSVGEIWGSL